MTGDLDPAGSPPAAAASPPVPPATDHECPGPHCRRRVPRSQFACRAHWYQLPKPIRDAIWSGVRNSQRGQHTAAMQAALDFYEEARR